MRNQCLRFLLRRCRTHAQPNVFQVHVRSLTSSFLHSHSPLVTPKSLFTPRCFSSTFEISVEPPKPPPAVDQAVLLAEIFANTGKSNDDIKQDLDSNNVVLTRDLILSVLGNPDTAPDVAGRIFYWVLEWNSEILSCKSFNSMLGILGANGLVKESWDMIDFMRRKGYGVHKEINVRICEKFKKNGLTDDVEKLKKLYALSNGNAIENICARISKLIRSEVWGDELEERLRNMNVEFSGDLVTMVLEALDAEPNKALIFFRWIEENNLFEHNQQCYNAMAIVLSREEYTEKFWKVVTEMRSKGHEMEKETYIKILNNFVRRKMISDAVDLYEFAMIGENNPSVQDCTFLLKKIVVAKELDMDLFAKVVSVFKASGNEFTNAHLDAILKSLSSVGRMADCNRILAALKDGGYLPNGPAKSKIAFRLSSGGQNDKVVEFMQNVISASNCSPDNKIWVSLVEGYCAALDLDKASSTFRDMIEDEGASCAGYSLDLLVRTFCQNNRPFDAYKLVSEMVREKGLSPWNTTYRELTSKLLVKRKFKEAMDVMKMMQNQGYSPYLDSFVKYLSKYGRTEEAVAFTQAMTSKRFPAKSVFLTLFESYLKAGRQSEAQDFLSKCPSFIRNHADVLNLFCSMKNDDVAKNAVVAV